jgi:sulfur-oxidizing protein SoxZ
MATPPPLLSVPSQASRGQVMELRALIRHPMETGYRPDENGRLQARDLIRLFTCTYLGREVFRATLHPAIAANPYLTFTLRAEASGGLHFLWEGDNGFRETAVRSLTVT